MHRKMALSASAETDSTLYMPRLHFTHILRSAGNPCLHSHSTTPSLAQTIRPPNSRNLRCSRKEATWCQAEWRNHCPGPGSPYHGHGSTKSSSRQPSRPANSRIHQHSCKGRLGPEAGLAARRGGGDGSTKSASSPSRQTTEQRRSCKDRPGREAASEEAA